MSPRVRDLMGLEKRRVPVYDTFAGGAIADEDGCAEELRSPMAAQVQLDHCMNAGNPSSEFADRVVMGA